MARELLGIQVDENLLTARSHAKLMREVMGNLGETHKQKNLPKHFQSVPETRVGGEYGYAARSLKWQKRKAREGKPREANVYTGRTQQTVTTQSVVTKTQYKATVKVKNYFPMRVQMRKELEAVTSKEAKGLAKGAGKYYASEAKSGKYQERKRHRS